MKTNKKIITGAILMAMITIMPIASFADSNKNSTETKESHSPFSSLKNKVYGWMNNTSHNRNIDFYYKQNPIISGITAPTVLRVGEVGTWKINARDSHNDSLSYSVDWGETRYVNNGSTSMTVPVFDQEGTFTHTYYNKGVYKINFTVTNSNGGKEKSTVTVNVVNSKDITEAPVISGVNVKSVKIHTAKIEWLTDVKSNSIVWYGTNQNIDTSKVGQINRGTSTKKHEVELNKLQPGTTYYVVIGSTNKSGTTKSEEFSFKTLGKNNDSSPVITSVDGQSKIKAGETETVTINAYDPQNGTLSYYADWGDNNRVVPVETVLNTKTIFEQSATLSHTYNSPGTYIARFTVENSNGKKDTSSMKIIVTSSETDTTGPVISNVEIKVNSETGTISWSTDELATSEISYFWYAPIGIKWGDKVVKVDNSLSTKHSFNLSGLAPASIYHFTIKSTDASNNTTTSNEYSFMTLGK